MSTEEQFEQESVDQETVSDISTSTCDIQIKIDQLAITNQQLNEQVQNKSESNSFEKNRVNDIQEENNVVLQMVNKNVQQQQMIQNLKLQVQSLKVLLDEKDQTIKNQHIDLEQQNIASIQLKQDNQILLENNLQQINKVDDLNLQCKECQEQLQQVIAQNNQLEKQIELKQKENENLQQKIQTIQQQLNEDTNKQEKQEKEKKNYQKLTFSQLLKSQNNFQEYQQFNTNDSKQQVKLTQLENLTNELNVQKEACQILKKQNKQLQKFQLSNQELQQQNNVLQQQNQQIITQLQQCEQLIQEYEQIQLKNQQHTEKQNDIVIDQSLRLKYLNTSQLKSQIDAQQLTYAASSGLEKHFQQLDYYQVFHVNEINSFCQQAIELLIQNVKELRLYANQVDIGVIVEDFQPQTTQSAQQQNVYNLLIQNDELLKKSHYIQQLIKMLQQHNDKISKLRVDGSSLLKNSTSVQQRIEVTGIPYNSILMRDEKIIENSSQLKNNIKQQIGQIDNLNVVSNLKLIQVIDTINQRLDFVQEKINQIQPKQKTVLKVDSSQYLVIQQEKKQIFDQLNIVKQFLQYFQQYFDETIQNIITLQHTQKFEAHVGNYVNAAKHAVNECNNDNNQNDFDLDMNKSLEGIL